MMTKRNMILSILLATAVCALLVISPAAAQTPERNNVVGIGPLHDNGDGLGLGTVYAFKLSNNSVLPGIGGSLWSITRVGTVTQDSTKQMSGEEDVAYCFGSRSAFFGVFGGAGGSWNGSEDFINYWTGATGILAGVSSKSGLGVTAAARYTFTLDGKDMWINNGWQVGAVLTYSY